MVSVDRSHKCYFEHSFSYLTWSIIQKIDKGILKIQDLSESMFEQILYVILPGGNTILHHIYDKEE